MNTLILYAAATLTALILDGLWLGLLMGKTYQRELSQFLRLKPAGGMDPIKWAALLVYILIPAGIVFFVYPKIERDSWVQCSLAWGFLFGIILYGVYDFTNYSLVKDWPLKITLIDLVWGGVLCAITTLVTTWVSFQFAI